MITRTISVSQSRDHPNWTGRAPRASRYDGQGGFKKNSYRIPPIAVIGTIAFIVGAAAMWFVGCRVF